jgi:hypothetical protein
MADYATIDAKSLGNYSTYQPSTQQKMDVVFQPDLSSGYYSALALNPMGGNGIGYDLEHDIDISGEKENKNEMKEEKPIYSVGKNPINGLFIGTVTVLGLFVLYRMLQK